MEKKILITAGKVEMEASLSENHSASLLWAALPITGRANTWGEEIYFAIPLEAEPEQGAREEMEVGEIAYWPPGKAFCIFFGPTPASSGEVPRAASAVNPLGRVDGDAKRFIEVQNGEEVRLERAG